MTPDRPERFHADGSHTCAACSMHVPVGWDHDCGGTTKRSRNVEREPDEWVGDTGRCEPDDLEHRRIPAARWFLVAAVWLLVIAGAALAGAPETSPPPMPRPEAGE